MRYPPGHKEAVRAKIVAAAARALRRDGPEGVSIPKLMEEVGLTHGGFYNHFEDKDELLAECIRFAAATTGAGVLGPENDLATALAGYLSPGHAAHPEQGCVVAALGSDARRQPAPVKRAFGEAARGLLRIVDAKLRPGATARGADVSDDALRLTSQMVGAVILARMVGDGPLAQRILAAARRA
jgi:TetR/AcrR family transcriptional repressor of nem operon